MEFWDIVRPTNPENVVEMTEFGKKLGWKGVCALFSDPEHAKGLPGPKGLIITESNPDRVRAVVAKFRRSFELIVLESDSIELNRSAANIPGIDVLISEKIDQGIVRLLSQSGIQVLITFASLLHTHNASRIRIWQTLVDRAALMKTKGFILCSGSHMMWDMRSPSELIAFGRLLGFTDPDIKRALSGWLIKRNAQRLRSGWVAPGVRQL